VEEAEEVEAEEVEAEEAEEAHRHQPQPQHHSN
jgi:hypothetical protein